MGKKYPYIVSDQEKKSLIKTVSKFSLHHHQRRTGKDLICIYLGLVELLHFFSHQTHITTYARRQAVEMWRCAKLSTNTKTQNFLTITRLLKMATKFMPIFNSHKKEKKSDCVFFSICHLIRLLTRFVVCL